MNNTTEEKKESEVIMLSFYIKDGMLKDIGIVVNETELPNTWETLGHLGESLVKLIELNSSDLQIAGIMNEINKSNNE